MRSLFMPHGHIVSSRLRRTDSTPILSRMLFQAGSLLLVIISVYLLKRIHIFSDKSYEVVQGLVFNLTLPCANAFAAMAVPVQHHHRAVRMVPSAVRRTRPRNRGAGRVRAGDDLLHEIH